MQAERYGYAERKKARFLTAYHLVIDRQYYSLPYQLYDCELDVCLTATTVECFHKEIRVASHRRSSQPAQHFIAKEHITKAHKSCAEWTPEGVIAWTPQTGPFTKGLAEEIIASRLYPQQAFRSCLGLMRVGKIYGSQRLQAASKRALIHQATRHRNVNAILKSALDKEERVTEAKALEGQLPTPNLGALTFEEFHNVRSTVVTTQQPVLNWHEALVDPALAMPSSIARFTTSIKSV